jgi:hypothetical protein
MSLLKAETPLFENVIRPTHTRVGISDLDFKPSRCKAQTSVYQATSISR